MEIVEGALRRSPPNSAQLSVAGRMRVVSELTTAPTQLSDFASGSAGR